MVVSGRRTFRLDPVVPSAVAVVLLTVRFAWSTGLAAVELPADAIASAAHLFEIYDAIVPFLLLFALLLLLLPLRGSARSRWVWTVPIVHLAALILAIFLLRAAGPSSPQGAFAAMAVLVVTFSSAFSLHLSQGSRRAVGGWGTWAHIALLILVPLAFSMRVASAFGLGTTVTASGTVEGNWLFVNMPTILMELMAIGVWANVALDTAPFRVHGGWRAFLPLAAAPVALAAFAARPLSGYVFSALITWGSNLQLFAPPFVSLTLAAFAIGSYASTWLLLRAGGNNRPRCLLFLGTAAIALAGFYPSMASVEGLSMGLILSTVAWAGWAPESKLPPEGAGGP